jgi:hypothetical protein
VRGRGVRRSSSGAEGIHREGSEILIYRRLEPATLEVRLGWSDREGIHC